MSQPSTPTIRISPPRTRPRPDIQTYVSPARPSKESYYVVIKCLSGYKSKPEYKICSITPSGQPIPKPRYSLYKAYDKVPIPRSSSSSIVEETFIINLQRDEFTAETRVVACGAEKSEMGDVVRDVSRNIDSGWDEKDRVNAVFDDDGKLVGARGLVDGEYWWVDVVEVDVLSGEGYHFPRTEIFVWKSGEEWGYLKEESEDKKEAGGGGPC